MSSSFWLPPQSNTPLKEKKALHELIAPNIKEGDCYDAWKCFSYHCANEISQVQGITLYQSYSPLAHSDSFRINISITYMHRLTGNILDVSNEFQNTNVPIHEKVCVSPPLYYLD